MYTGSEDEMVVDEEIAATLYQYKQTKNVIYLWEAWRIASSKNLVTDYVIPEVFEYLDKVAQLLTFRASNNENGAQIKRDLWDILGFSSEGYGTPFSSYAKDCDKIDAYIFRSSLIEEFFDVDKVEIAERLFPGNESIKMESLGKTALINRFVAEKYKVSVKTLEKWMAEVPSKFPLLLPRKSR